MASQRSGTGRTTCCRPGRPRASRCRPHTPTSTSPCSASRRRRAGRGRAAQPAAWTTTSRSPTPTSTPTRTIAAAASGRPCSPRSSGGLARRAGERVLVEVYAPAGRGRPPATRRSRSRGATRWPTARAIKAVDLVASEPRWAALEEQVGRRPRRLPRRHLARPLPRGVRRGASASALSRVMSLIPQGELDLEDSEWTVDRVRAVEERRPRSARHVRVGRGRPRRHRGRLTGRARAARTTPGRPRRRDHGAAGAPRSPARAGDEAGHPPGPARGRPATAASWSPATPTSTRT